MNQCGSPLPVEQPTVCPMSQSLCWDVGVGATASTGSAQLLAADAHSVEGWVRGWPQLQHAFAVGSS
jgi:hypothetical protein